MRRAAFPPTLFAGLLLCACAALAQDAGRRTATMIQDVVAGERHENGEARWDSVVLTQLTNICGLSGPDRKIELGDKASPEPRANADDCVAASAWIQNTSAQPIYCRAVLELNQPDDTGRKEITAQGVVMPGAMKDLATAYGEAARMPRKAQTECKVYEPALPPPPHCDFKLISAPNPESFYPEESKRREEQGDVTLDFRVDSASQKLRDIRVSESSGYRLLDIAALEVGRQMRAASSCPDRRRRVKVKFRATVTDPASLPAAPPPAS